MPEERHSAYGLYTPRCEENDCRDSDAHVCAIMKDEAHWTDRNDKNKWCQCKECHQKEAE